MLKQKLYNALATPENDRISGLNAILMVLIVISIIIAILDTESSLATHWHVFFNITDSLFLTAFGVEYLVRLWVCVLDVRYAHPVWGRLKYLISPIALTDLLSLLPVMIVFGWQPSYLFRMFRLLRIMRLSRIGHIFRAYDMIAEVFAEKKSELIASLMLSLAAMLISATLLYFAEGRAQPEVFGSIPRALWWAVVTLTTIGYGDAYPITPLGKVLASISAIIGVGLIAAPTGILAAGFSDVSRRHSEQKEARRLAESQDLKSSPFSGSDARD